MRSIKNHKPSNRESGGGKTDIKGETDALAQKYAGKSESELIGGTFSAQQLDEFVQFVSPSLDDESRSRLAYLVGMIKGN